MKRKTKTGVLILALLCPAPAWAVEPFEVPLRPKAVPGFERSALRETFTNRPVSDGSGVLQDRSLAGVVTPSLTVYLPEEDKRTGTAVIICPGGGFTHLAIDKEGHDVARWLTANGIAGIVLKYRLPDPDREWYVVNTAVPDVQRALRVVRRRAGEWGVNPQRIGVMGFSAGGYLAAVAGTRFDEGDSQAADPVERQSSRPDFITLAYPLVSLRRHTWTSPDRVKRIVGPKVADSVLEKHSPDRQVRPESPPAFLVHAADDRLSAENSVAFHRALSAKGVRAELHVYSKGGHGFGIRERGLPVSEWKQRWLDWLRAEEFLGPVEAAKRRNSGR